MPFVSYAQNGEDVLLWRAFGALDTGFYVDVGAAHPDEDSVTRAFYDRGWRGINIEPVPAMARRIADARPRDVTLAAAAAAFDGHLDLHMVEGTGLSTTDAEVAAMLRGAGYPAETVRVPARRLDAILRDHAPADVHFLKIDVEGAEASVLAGCDLRACRPRVLLVEATRPLSSTPSQGAWEALVTGAGYRFVLFDGLNRYYVADEWVAALAGHFATPVNVLDDYVRVSDAAWARRAAAQEAAVAQQAARAATAETEASAAYARAFEAARDLGSARMAAFAAVTAHRVADELRAAADQGREKADEARDRADQARDRADRARADADALRQAAEERERERERERDAALRRLDALYRSTSWRVTRPIRALSTLARSSAPAVADAGPAPTPPPPEPMVPEQVPGPDSVETTAPEVTREAAPQAAEPPSSTAAAVGGCLLRTVHQFHSGSALGDAVTNSLLLIRRQLRALGYRSDIFVQHRDPALRDELRLMDELPRHTGYVLIVHHSMGYDALGDILALPAPKLLYYHNVTPVEFLPEVATLRRYGAMGREQLAELRPAVSAALAASEYNAIELRRAGFAPVQACTLLFDLDAMARDAPRDAPRDAQPVFTVLFVGRLIESKGQADLVDAFAEFRRRFGQPARLVLVGKADSPGDYLSVIDGRIRKHGLEDAVTVTGAVSDAALDLRYAAASLYVSLSHHEGFGVPLVEAAARGIPVLAWPCGAVSYTLQAPGSLLPSRGAADVAERILALARDPDARAALARAQRGMLDRFALHRQWPAMQDALARAGAAPPRDAAAVAALGAGLQLVVTGHVAGSYSLAAVNRGLAAAIEAEMPGRVRLLPFENGPVAGVAGLPDAARALAGRPAASTGPVVAVSNHYPVHVPDGAWDLRLALVFWEETLLPAGMVATLNQGFDGVLAPSRSVAKALVDSGLVRPVRVVGQAPDLRAFEDVALSRGPDRAAGEVFTFLHVSSCFPRKGADVLLRAYSRAFRRGDAVRLVIKTFPNPHNTVPEQVAALRQDPDAPEVGLVNQDLDEAAMLELYRQADAMVLPTRGEGLNLPAAEAMAAGVPLVVTGHGGHLDFCDASTARLVPYRLAPSGSHLASAFSLWAEPDEDDLVAALQEMEAARRDGALAAELAKRAGRARVAVAQRLSRKGMVRRIAAAAVDLLLAPAPEVVRVAWVTSWAVRCGVAEYSRHLLGAMPDGTPVRHVVLADDRTVAVPDAHPRAVPSWQAGHADVSALLRAVSAEDPHVVVVQHQPGLVPWAGLAAALASPAMAGRVAVVTLHATRGLADVEPGVRDAVCAALRGVSRVVVHTLGDVHGLQDLGVEGNVLLMPHGVRASLPRHAARVSGPAPLVGCYGFLLPGKGVAELIQALVSLRATHPGARLRLVNADYGVAASRDEIARCRALAAEAGLDGSIEWETRFLPDDESVALLSACDVVAVPTQHSLEASSAAVRTALAAGPPVLVTPLSLFDDVGDAVARSGGTAPGDLAAGLAALLSDAERQAQVQAAAGAWLETHAWVSVAERFQAMLLGLRAPHVFVTDD